MSLDNGSYLEVVSSLDMSRFTKDHSLGSPDIWRLFCAHVEMGGSHGDPQQTTRVINDFLHLD